MKDCERNILPDPISGQEAFDKLVEHILGKRLVCSDAYEQGSS